MQMLVSIASIRWVLLAVAWGVQPAASQTPVATVISLLAKLKYEVTSEGQQEADTYETFACFCKDKTLTKSEAITTGQDNIDLLSASIADDTQKAAEKSSNLQSRSKQQEQLGQDLAAEEARCSTERQKYDQEYEHTRQALEAIERARAALQAAHPDSEEAAEALVALSRSTRALTGNHAMSSLAKLSASAGDLARAQVDPADPEYKFHSNHLIKLLTDLAAQLKDNKDQIDADWKQTSDACIAKKDSMSQAMTENKIAMEDLQTDIAELQKGAANGKLNLLQAQGDMQDDQLYLKDLTARCEARAKEWDQRSTTRAQEVEAISQAMDILQDKVAGADAEVNERAMLWQASKKTPGKAKKSLSFLQLRGSRNGRRELRSLSPDGRKEKALAVLGEASRKLSSSALSALAVKVSAADPFIKVKDLIQKLIERLLKESAEEATKKGFCDTELAKAEQDRKFNLAKVKKKIAEVFKLKALAADLDNEAGEMTSEAGKLKEDLVNATELREEEKAENINITRTAKEGLAAVTEAIEILEGFYKHAAKASVLQVHAGASPVDEDTSGAGFEGAYKGAQESSTGVIGLLKVIKSDFERTLRKTKAEEQEAASEFVKFDRTSKADIAGKETKAKLNSQDLDTTEVNLRKAMDDLQTYMGLTDQALAVIENLQPLCVATGMSYSERVEKRDAEMQALKVALCILDTEHVEPECYEECDD